MIAKASAASTLVSLSGNQPVWCKRSLGRIGRLQQGKIWPVRQHGRRLINGDPSAGNIMRLSSKSHLSFC